MEIRRRHTLNGRGVLGRAPRIRDADRHERAVGERSGDGKARRQGQRRANTRSPGPAVTLLSGCGPDILNRIAPSAPGLGVASETVSTPATGPVPPSLQLPAAPETANATSSHPLSRVIEMLLSAWPRSRALAARR